MLCYEIWLNGEKLCVIGHKDAFTLEAGVMFHKKIESQFINLSAITLAEDSKVRECIWETPWIGVGNEILIKLVESDAPHKPDHELLFAQRVPLLVAGKTQCSFCGTEASAGTALFDGTEARICEACIEYRHGIMHNKSRQD